MRVLAVQPGASFSTDDVYKGLGKGLQACGVEVLAYRLDNRIGLAHDFTRYRWRKAHKEHPELPKPSYADVLYFAGQGVLEQALRYDVDWVIIVSGMYFMHYWMSLLRKAGLKVGLILTESPYEDELQAEWAEEAAITWTNERTSVPMLRDHCPNVFYLPHAYDPDIHRPDLADDPDMPAHDVVFVGTGWQERIELFSQVDWTGIDFGLYGTWDLLGSRHPLRKHLRLLDGGNIIPREKTAALYRKAKIGLNLHRLSKDYTTNGMRIDHAESLNPRAYELAASGCFTITDIREEIRDVLPGSTVFASPQHLQEQVRYYLEHSEQRQEHIDLLRGRVQPHTYRARAEQMLANIASVEGQRETAYAAIG